MSPVVAAINHLLDQHPTAQARLKTHAGKTLRVDAPPFVLTLVVTPAGGVGAAPEADANDIAFRLNPAQWPLLFGDPEAAMKSVRIEGDAEFAQLIGMLMRELRWDAEEDLSRIIGDVPAYRAMQALRSFTAWGRDAAQRLAGNGAAFLVDEEPLLVRGRMVEQFANQVTEGRDICARLEKRIEILEARRLSGRSS